MSADAKKDDAHLVETKVSSEPVFDGKLLHVRRDTVRLPDGTLATREHIVHPGRRADRSGACPTGASSSSGSSAIRSTACSSSSPRASSTRANRRSRPRGASCARRRATTATTWTPLGMIHTLDLVHERADRPLRRRRARRTSARKLDDGEFLDIVTMSETRCWRRSTAARSPTRRRSPRCCSTCGGGATMIARRLVVRGRVQGVGFRYAMVESGAPHGVAGWVRNRRDGTVEAFVQGDARGGRSGHRVVPARAAGRARRSGRPCRRTAVDRRRAVSRTRRRPELRALRRASDAGASRTPKTSFHAA